MLLLRGAMANSDHIPE